jgi:predicted GNAT family N-acyltransferase
LTIVRKVVSQAELKRALSIRLRVFVQEQGVPREIELDTDDQRATHFLAYFVGRAVGTARVVFSENQAKVGRMAVLKSFRNKGVGRELLERTVRLAWKKGADSIANCKISLEEGGRLNHSPCTGAGRWIL